MVAESGAIATVPNFCAPTFPMIPMDHKLKVVFFFWGDSLAKPSFEVTSAEVEFAQIYMKHVKESFPTTLNSNSSYICRWFLFTPTKVGPHLLFRGSLFQCRKGAWQNLKGNAIWKWSDLDLTRKKNNIHPGKLTWNSSVEVWKMMFLFNWVTFGFHVNFQGCTPTEV